MLLLVIQGFCEDDNIDAYQVAHTSSVMCSNLPGGLARLASGVDITSLDLFKMTTSGADGTWIKCFKVWK